MSDERVAISLPGIALCIAFDYAASVYDVYFGYYPKCLYVARRIVIPVFLENLINDA